MTEITFETFENNLVKRTNLDGTVTWIPIDPANSDYQEYLSSIEPAEPEAE
jgi:hypothetical protein